MLKHFLEKVWKKGPVGRKRWDRKGNRTRQKNKTGDSKVELNDSPEIPDRGETSDFTDPLRGCQGHYERGRSVWQKCQLRHQLVSVRDIMNTDNMRGKSVKYVISQSVSGTSWTRPRCVAKVLNTSSASQCKGHHEQGRHVWQKCQICHQPVSARDISELVGILSRVNHKGLHHS